MDQVPVSSVQFDHVKPGPMGTFGGFAPRFDRIRNLLEAQLARDGPAIRIGNGTRANDVPFLPVLDLRLIGERPVALPWPLGLAFTTRMAELKSRRCTVALDEIGD